jgi:predicted nucleic acid-binding protein
MIVVSDTSPLTNLAVVGQFDLLRKLFGEIHISQGVWEELNASGEQHPGSQEVERAAWIYRHPVANSALVATLRRDLDRGEAETLALAVELKAEIALVDEKEGRHAAARLGLKPLGVLGLLLEAKRRQEIAEVRPILDILRQRAGFYIRGDLYRWVLEQAAEKD